MSGKSLYDILQVSPNAAPEVIRAAYKSLAAKYHPDRDSTTEAARRFAEIQAAFAILSDPDQRRNYDADPSRGTAARSVNSVVFRVDGTSTFLTLQEHVRRNFQDSAKCDLSGHDFRNMSFNDAKLGGAKLDGSRFVGCDFRGADLTGCSANDCEFDKVAFGRTRMSKTSFVRSSFRGANFPAHSEVSLCDFAEANLADALMREVDFRKSTFTRANLQRAQMQKCNLHGVDLSTANLIDADLTACSIGDATRFPDGYPTPKSTRNLDVEQRDRDKTARAITNLFISVGLIFGVICFIAVFFMIYGK